MTTPETIHVAQRPEDCVNCERVPVAIEECLYPVQHSYIVCPEHENYRGHPVGWIEL